MNVKEYVSVTVGQSDLRETDKRFTKKQWKDFQTIKNQLL